MVVRNTHPCRPLPPPRPPPSAAPQLQNLDCSTQVFVSLNPHTPPASALVHETLRYRHPQFSPRAERGQRLLPSIDGKRGLWFCGAWSGYGFHEVRTYVGYLEVRTYRRLSTNRRPEVGASRRSCRLGYGRLGGSIFLSPNVRKLCYRGR